MSTHEERVVAATRVRTLIASGVGAQLRAIPGVHHVAAGLTAVDGTFTRTVGIQVWFNQTLTDGSEPDTSLVPDEFDGVETSIHVMMNVRPLDRSKYRPVKGATMVGNGIIVMKDGAPATTEGTFGCTATRVSDGDIMLLSNAHVLMANGAQKGTRIYQPPPEPSPFLTPADLPFRPSTDDNMIAEVVDFAATPKVDAAIARLDVSSCCRCCGIDWRDEVLGPAGADDIPVPVKLQGLRRAEIGDPVFLLGSITHRSEGIVFTDDFPPFSLRPVNEVVTFTGQIGIAPVDEFLFFSQDGDSGSVVVDEDDFIVGLNFAGNNKRGSDGFAVANHISDVCSALRITINLDRTVGDTAGAPSARRAPRMSDAEVEVYAAARSRLLAHPVGEWLWGLADAHREEVVDLVTRHRPVTVAWHRAGGPALFAAALKSLRTGAEQLPAPADGSTLEASLAKIGDALHTHGSESLRAAIDAHRATILDAVRDSDTVSAALNALRILLPESVAAPAGGAS